MSELVTVFMMKNGPVLYRGYPFSVTLRTAVLDGGQVVRGTMDMARLMMDDMIDAYNFTEGSIVIDPAFAVVAPRDDMDQRPPDEQDMGRPFGTPSAAPAATGNRKSEHTLTIARGTNSKGKTVYFLSYKLGNGGEPKAPLEISTNSAVAALESALTAAGYDPTKVPASPYPFEMQVSWEPGKEFAKGKCYRENMTFEILTKRNG